MSYQLTSKVRDLTPYEPLQGEYKIRLDANESYLLPPENLRRELSELTMNQLYNRYPDSTSKEVCTAFARYYGVSPEAVTAGNGSDELISILVSCLLKDGDRILTLSPDFSMYRFYGGIYEHPVSVVEKNKDFTIDVDTVVRAVRGDNIGMLLFSNPCNPTSVGLNRAGVLRLIEALPETLIVVDEAYMDFWDQSILEETVSYSNVIVLRTCSKAIGMAGIRLGFAVANPRITRALQAVKSPYNVNALTQAIGAKILREMKYLDCCTEKIKAATAALYAGVKRLVEEFPVLEELLPTVTNFVFLKTNRAGEIAKELGQRSIAVRCFGGFLRISAGSPKENEAFLHALEEICKGMI